MSLHDESTLYVRPHPSVQKVLGDTHVVTPVHASLKQHCDLRDTVLNCTSSSGVLYLSDSGDGLSERASLAPFIPTAVHKVIKQKIKTKETERGMTMVMDDVCDKNEENGGEGVENNVDERSWLLLSRGQLKETPEHFKYLEKLSKASEEPHPIPPQPNTINLPGLDKHFTHLWHC